MQIHIPTKKEQIILEKTKKLIKTNPNINAKFLMEHFKIGWALATRVIDNINSSLV